MNAETAMEPLHRVTGECMIADFLHKSCRVLTCGGKRVCPPFSALFDRVSGACIEHEFQSETENP